MIDEFAKDKSEKIRVASIIEESRIGGPQIRMIRVGKYLHNLGVDNTIICPKLDSEEFTKILKDESINYQSVNLTRLSKQPLVLIRYIILFPFEIIGLYRILKKGNFELAHICGGAWQFKGVIASLLAGKKIVWHLNDSFMPLPVRKIFKLLSKYVDGFIYASEITRLYYTPYIRAKRTSEIIRQPVDTSEYLNTMMNSSPFHKENPSKRRRTIGTLANINPVKDFETFIRAAKKINKSATNVEFLIGGPVPSSQQTYYQFLQSLISELKVANIRFLGKQEDSREFYQRCDIFLCTSLHEAGPMTVWEAMSMELPVISTDVGDVSKFLISGETGEVVEVGDVDQLAHKVCELLENPETCRRYGRNARNIIKQNFDAQACAKLHAKIYKAILEK